MDMGYVLEERYTTIRDAIFRILSMSPDYSVEVANAFIEVFAPLMDDGEHGAVLWALMVKTQVCANEGWKPQLNEEVTRFHRFQDSNQTGRFRESKLVF